MPVPLSRVDASQFHDWSSYSVQICMFVGGEQQLTVISIGQILARDVAGLAQYSYT